MFSKNFEKGKPIIPEIKSRQASKSKASKRQEVEYGTDLKRQLDKSLVSNGQPNQNGQCTYCRARMSQFITKKPNHTIDKGSQTSHKPFLIDLIQEKVQKMCRANAQLTRTLQQREDQLFERQQEIEQAQDKFTSILLELAKEVARSRKHGEEWFQLKKILQSDSDTPAYLKALQFDC